MKEIRTCISCKCKKDKSQYIRIVKDSTGHCIVDTSHKYNSRGIYICDDKKCIDRLLKMKDLSKLLKIDVTKEEFLKLISELGENIL